MLELVQVFLVLFTVFLAQNLLFSVVMVYHNFDCLYPVMCGVGGPRREGGGRGHFVGFSGELEGAHLVHCGGAHYVFALLHGARRAQEAVDQLVPGGVYRVHYVVGLLLVLHGVVGDGDWKHGGDPRQHHGTDGVGGGHFCAGPADVDYRGQGGQWGHGGVVFDWEQHL